MSSDHIIPIDFIDDSSVRSEAVADLIERLTTAPVDMSLALADFVPDVDEHQAMVVRSRDRTVRMLAPAGSGKTQTIINRALARVKQGIRPSRLLILTFDNAAAIALREKLAQQLAQLSAGGPDSQLTGLRISTLNAFGYRLLGDHFPPERRQIASEGRRHRIMRETLEALKARSPERHAVLGGNLRTGVYLDFFSLLKNEMFDPRELDGQSIAAFILQAQQAEPFFANPTPDGTRLGVQGLAWLYQTYELKLSDQRLMEFDDQKLRAFVLLRDTSATCDAIQSAFDEVVVDEFQDINRLDFELIRLVSDKADLVVTGDDDQAIYGFRGCSPDYIINLESRLGRQVTSHELKVNYRCPPNIVQFADQLIRHNTNRVAKSPVAARTDPAVVKVVSSQTAGVEARAVVTFVRRVMSAQPALSYDDFVVLYRTNAQSLPLQVEFVLNDIPYFVREQDNIVNSESLDRLLALLRVKIALGRGRQPTLADQGSAIASYFRYWSASQAEAARTVLKRTDDFLAALRSPDLIAAIPKASSRVADAFDALSRAGSLNRTLETVTERFRGVRGMVGSLEEAITEQVPLGEVFELAAHFGGTVEDFVTMMESAVERARRTNAGESEDGVSLLTYFKSKGRQWHTVILTTCNEGLIPHGRAEIEDERRLFYVANDPRIGKSDDFVPTDSNWKEGRTKSLPGGGRSRVTGRSYSRNCRTCGRRIHLRQMPQGQWVAFEGYDTVHHCAKPPVKKSKLSPAEQAPMTIVRLLRRRQTSLTSTCRALLLGIRHHQRNPDHGASQESNRHRLGRNARCSRRKRSLGGP